MKMAGDFFINFNPFQIFRVYPFYTTNVTHNIMKVFYAIALFFVSIEVSAQKLPDIQTTTLAAPVSIRIDGKNTEWSNFSAENKRTSLFYSIANDDKNLYLAIKATNNETITKVLAGGISFSVNNKGKKKEDESFTITYPLIARANIARPAGQAGGGFNRQRMGQNRSDQSQEQRDSVAYEQRKVQLAGVKEIKIKGFANIPDSLISIYNEYGIKAIAKMDEQKAYFCEIAIPLSTLQISIGDKKEIAYQIKLNGRQRGGGNFAMRTNAGGFGGGNRGGFGGGGNNSAQQDLMVATDFWGKYIVQK